jgi:hypothetical protein
MAAQATHPILTRSGGESINCATPRSFDRNRVPRPLSPWLPYLSMSIPYWSFVGRPGGNFP